MTVSWKMLVYYKCTVYAFSLIIYEKSLGMHFLYKSEGFLLKKLVYAGF